MISDEQLQKIIDNTDGVTREMARELFRLRAVESVLIRAYTRLRAIPFREESIKAAAFDECIDLLRAPPAPATSPSEGEAKS